MAVKIYKPITPGMRGMTGYTFEEITKSKPERSLITFRKQNSGRNNYGRVTVRMKELGTVVEGLVPPTIERKDRSRMITVRGIVAKNAALSDAVESCEKALDGMVIPSEISTVIAGDYEDQQEMFSQMAVLIILMILLVYMVMASQFENLMGPFVIMFSVPFALVGVLLGLRITGMALGMMSIIGIIILIGIVVKNGIVLIDYTILCRERGMSQEPSAPYPHDHPDHRARYAPDGHRHGRGFRDVAGPGCHRVLGSDRLHAHHPRAHPDGLLLVHQPYGKKT